MYAWVALSVAYLCDSHPVPSSVLPPSHAHTSRSRARARAHTHAHTVSLSLSLCRRLQTPPPTYPLAVMIPFLHESPRCPSPLSPGWQSHRIANKRRASARHSSLALDATASDVPPLPPLLCPPTSLYTPFDCSPPPLLPIAAFLGPRCTRTVVDLLFPTFALTRPLSTHSSSPPSFPRFRSFLRQTVSSFHFLPLFPSASIRPPFYPILSVYPSTLSTSFSTFGGETYSLPISSTRFLLLPLLLLLHLYLPPLTPSTSEPISSLTLATPYDFCRPLHSLTHSLSVYSLHLPSCFPLFLPLSLSPSTYLSIYLSVTRPHSPDFSFVLRLSTPTHSSPISPPSSRPRALFLRLPSPPKPKPPPRSGTPTQI